MAAVAGDLQRRWSPQGDDFSGALTVADTQSPYASQTEALGAVFDALFYLDTMTKDRKLGQPLGLLNCSEDRCPDDVEGLSSGTGATDVLGNLIGFRTLFTGGEGSGFDDLLAQIGHADLAEQVLDAVDQATETAAALDGPLDQLIDEQPGAVELLHAHVKAITDLLKGDLATVLALQVPLEASGDND